MFRILGLLVSIITFPGVIIHELSHEICCRISGLRIAKVVYFQFGNPMGYVMHERMDVVWKIVLTSIGPFIFNTILGAIVILPASISVVGFKDYSNILFDILAWLGISILMHAFPSTGDAKVMWNTVIRNKGINILAKIITFPIIALIYIGAIGSFFWLDLAYAIAIAMLIPNILVLI